MITDTDQASRAGAARYAYLLLSFTALCWAANAVFGRLAVGEISPMVLVSLRWLGVVLLVSVFARHHVRRDWAALRRRLPYLVAMGASGFTIFNAFFYVAAHSTTALNIGILQGAIPVFVLIGAFAVYRTPVTGLQAIGVVLTILGVALVASAGDLSSLAALAINLGDLLMIIACAFSAAYAVGLRRRPAVSSLSLFAVMAAAAFATSLPFALIEAGLGRFQAPSATGWMIVSAVTLFPSFVAQIFFIQGVQLIGPGRAGIFVNLVPVFASFLAVAFLKEAFEAYHAVALALVLGGIWLSEHGKAA